MRSFVPSSVRAAVRPCVLPLFRSFVGPFVEVLMPGWLVKCGSIGGTAPSQTPCFYVGCDATLASRGFPGKKEFPTSFHQHIGPLFFTSSKLFRVLMQRCNWLLVFGYWFKVIGIRLLVFRYWYLVIGIGYWLLVLVIDF